MVRRDDGGGARVTGLCPVCRREIDAAPPDLVAELRAEARARGFTILPGERIREDAAAALLDRQPSSLRKWRQTDARLPYVQDRARRVTYSIRDIANFIMGDD